MNSIIQRTYTDTPILPIINHKWSTKVQAQLARQRHAPGFLVEPIADNTLLLFVFTSPKRAVHFSAWIFFISHRTLGGPKPMHMARCACAQHWAMVHDHKHRTGVSPRKLRPALLCWPCFDPFLLQHLVGWCTWTCCCNGVHWPTWTQCLLEIFSISKKKLLSWSRFLLSSTWPDHKGKQGVYYDDELHNTLYVLHYSDAGIPKQHKSMYSSRSYEAIPCRNASKLCNTIHQSEVFTPCQQDYNVQIKQSANYVVNQLNKS